MRLLITLLFFSLSAQASVDSDFQAAREAYQKGKFERFFKYADKIPESYPLAPYLRFWRLKANTPGNVALRKFIDENPDTPLSDRLRNDLARQYGRAENWAEFRLQYQAMLLSHSRPDQELQCFNLRSRLAEGGKVEAEGVALWRTARDLPSSCDPLFSALAESGTLTTEDRLARLRLALDDNNLRLAREMNARLGADLAMEDDALARAQRDPERFLDGAVNTAGQHEAALYALTQIAKKAPETAARVWETQQTKFPEAEQRYGWGQIGLHAARSHDPRALAWFTRAGTPQSEAQLLWKTRASLRGGKWLDVYNSIEAMPEALRNEPVWRYWKARALKAMNANYPANVLFAKLSQEINYYGLLAEEELPARLEERPVEYKVTPDDLKTAEAHIGLKRSLLLRRLGDMGNATGEWDWALRGMSDRQILAAAELARREGWYDRAISSADRTRSEHDFDLRYIAPYRDLATAYAHNNSLDEAWVFGLMRQESRFVDYARSGVGASGLMQIMPATAKWIANRLGLGRKAHAGVNNPETNIRFGTYYLKHIYDSLDQSPVLATAGYNAGPGRARKWQAETALEGAIYVESIPFSETREYVKKVLANAMFYRNRFGGEARPLKDRLGTILARNPNKPLPADEAAPQP
ncbi:MAG: transglycosylase SLT domain-containing protein [Pseudomonadota bacterium]|nr:transglycosylase SLT domain-containing protein [Pseudomonadota bacterium]